MPTPKRKAEPKPGAVALTEPTIPDYESIGVFYQELANGEQYIGMPLSGIAHVFTQESERCLT